MTKEIIRCKNCKHRDPEDKKCDCGHDIVWQLPRSDEWFCADGEPLSEYDAWFFIGETLVDVSKCHLTAEEGIEKIRGYMQQMKMPTD